MAATLVELRLSTALSPGAFDPAALGTFDLDAEASTLDSTPSTGPAPQRWLVARVHLVEELGRPFRCEVLITRREVFVPDPSTPGAKTWFERLSDRMGDSDGNSNDDLQSASDQLRGRGWGLGGGDLPAGLLDYASDVFGILGSQFGDWPRDVKQDLLGIQPTRWYPELAPRPGEFLGSFRSVLLRRLAAVDRRILHGRWVSGLVTEFEDLGVFGIDRRLVRLVIEPQLAKLALKRRHQIYERKTALAIVQDIFREAGVYPQGFDAGTTQLVERPHTIQYGETDLDFVLRLFSEEGLIPIFEHHLGAEHLRLVTAESLANGEGAAGTGPTGSVETLDTDDQLREELSHTAGDDGAQESLWSFSVRRLVKPVEASVRSTNFSGAASGTLSLPARVREETERPPAGQDAIDLAFLVDAPPELEASWHEFPCRTSFSFDEQTGLQTDLVDRPGDPQSEARLELFAARADVLRGKGRTNAVALSAGQRVGVTDGRMMDPALFDDEVRPFGRRFVLTKLELLAETGADGLGPQGTLWHLPPRSPAFSPTAPIALQSVIEAVPEEVRYVPPRLKAPLADGVQTAIVRASPTRWTEGASRIGVDVIGRVRARLHWDRREDESGEEKLSPPIRVATPWAGHAWGTTFLPREGMELLVAFLHGDPTQPIALGCVHGRVNTAPLERPNLEVVGKDNHLGDPTVRDDRRLHYTKDDIKTDEGRHLSVIRTQIHPEPDDRKRAYHELSFDDEPGEERVRLHSEGWLEETVENDHRTLVGRDQINVVQGRHTERVGSQELIVEGNREKIVLGNELEIVRGEQKVIVLGQWTEEVRGDLSRAVGKDATGDETFRIGEKKGDGVIRVLELDRDRKTLVEGDDERIVGGDDTGKIGGMFQLGGAPLDMKATSGAAGGPGVTSEDGEMLLDGADGKADLIAKGDVHIKAAVINLFGEKSVRFECGDVWIDISPSELAMNAPGGFEAQISGMPFVGTDGPRSHTKLEVGNVQDGGAIHFFLEGTGIPDADPEPADPAAAPSGGAADPAHRGSYHAVLRGGTRGGEPIDALEGEPGLEISSDVVEISGGIGAFECRKIEVQNGTGPMVVFRKPTEEEKQLQADIARLTQEVAELRREVRRLEQERDAKRDIYRLAAIQRQSVQAKIELDQGADDELKEAVQGVVDAERDLQKARSERSAAEIALDKASKAGEDASEKQDDLDEANDEVESAEEALREAEEELDEQREEHGALVDEYEKSRAEEERTGRELLEAQDRLVAANQELRRKDAELQEKRQRASRLELPEPSDPTAQAAE